MRARATNEFGRTGYAALVLTLAAVATVHAQPAPTPAASPAAETIQGPTEGNAPGTPAVRESPREGATNAAENATDQPDANRLFGNIDWVRSNQGENAAGLPGTDKLGAWYNSLNFGDHRDNASGVSLADPANVAPAHALRNDFSVYAVTDQLVWKEPGTTDGGIGVFARVMVAPPDRNLINGFVQGGITYKAPFAGRENDTVGLAASWAYISRNASKFDKDTIAFTGQALPVR